MATHFQPALSLVDGDYHIVSDSDGKSGDNHWVTGEVESGTNGDEHLQIGSPNPADVAMLDAYSKAVTSLEQLDRRL